MKFQRVTFFVGHPDHIGHVKVTCEVPHLRTSSVVVGGNTMAAASDAAQAFARALGLPATETFTPPDDAPTIVEKEAPTIYRVAVETTEHGRRAYLEPKPRGGVN